MCTWVYNCTTIQTHYCVQYISERRRKVGSLSCCGWLAAAPAPKLIYIILSHAITVAGCLVICPPTHRQPATTATTATKATTRHEIIVNIEQCSRNRMHVSVRECVVYTCVLVCSLLVDIPQAHSATPTTTCSRACVLMHQCVKCHNITSHIHSIHWHGLHERVFTLLRINIYCVYIRV